jgi:uncharacterized paraquat-inducible protein A
MMICSADKAVVLEDSMEISEDKSANSAFLVIAVVVPAVLVIVVVFVIIGCLIRRNKKSSLEGLCLINKKNILQNFHCILLFYFTQEVQT